VPFSCLDDQPEREAYGSRMGLKRLVTRSLADTNWRLMSDGVSHRLGYLSGRVRAFESEEELRTLIEKRPGGAKRKQPTAAPTPSPPASAEPAPAPKQARRGKQRVIRVRGVLHPNLIMVIPPREQVSPPKTSRRKKH